MLEGSVRKGKDRVRVTAQLIDALAGHHLWAEAYDRELKDILAVQSEITKEIITALEVKLTEGEQARVFARGTDNVEAWALGIKAWKLYIKVSKENMAKARELLERAIKLDPEYAFAWAALARTHYMDGRLMWSKSPADSYKRAIECSKKALSINEEDPFAHATLGSVLLFYQRKHEDAIAEVEKAISIDPNYADGYLMLASIMHFSGRFEEAIASIKKGMRLSPMPPAAYLFYLAWPNAMLERYEEAIPVWEQFLERCRRGEGTPWIGHMGLIFIYMELGREEEAKAEAQEILRLNPNFSTKFLRKFPWKDPAHLERQLSAFHKAGIPEKPPLPLPDKPSIAVLPFTNLSDDPKQEYFVDGMTDDLITDLSKISGLFVIARNSVFRYKGKPVDVKKVSRELGVRHVLEGSVRKAENQVRINAQLIDASTGGHLWAERYDGKMDDVFALQDKITKKIVKALAVELGADERERITKKETDNIAAYDAFLKGWGHYQRHTPEDYAKALSYFDKATELDPNYGRAYASKALIYSRVSKLGKNWLDALYLRNALAADRQAKKYLEMAMRNPTSTAYRASTFIKVYDRYYKAAIDDAKRALSLDPNDSGSHESMAFVLIMAGRPEEAFDFAKKTMRLDPLNIANPLYYVGLAHFCLKDFEEAANTLERALTYSPGHTAYLMALAAAYGHLGREEEAKATLKLIIETLTRMDAEFQRKHPIQAKGQWEHTIAGFGTYRYPPFKEKEMTDLFEGGLTKAGLKEIADFREALTNY